MNPRVRPILLVEDNPMDLDLTCQAFKEHSVHTFAQILSRCFRQHVHRNRYAQLIIKSTDAQELLRGAPALGERPLI